MDETGWRTAGQRRALWGAFTDRHAILAIAPDRHEDRAKALLADTRAIVTSDRWWAYTHLPVCRRQVCWAHLQRDFQAHADGLAAEQAFGQAGLRMCEELFWAWEIYQHTGERSELKRRVRALRRELKGDPAHLRRQGAALPLHARRGRRTSDSRGGDRRIN
jgi:transposase